VPFVLSWLRFWLKKLTWPIVFVAFVFFVAAGKNNKLKA
jgi:hypothetical protein